MPLATCHEAGLPGPARKARQLAMTMLTAALLGGATVAEAQTSRLPAPTMGERWFCYTDPAALWLTLMPEMFDSAPEIILTREGETDQPSSKGRVLVAGVVYDAEFQVQSINRRWDWNDDMDTISVRPNGEGAYFDFRRLEPGERVTQPTQEVWCILEELTDQTTGAPFSGDTEPATKLKNTSDHVAALNAPAPPSRFDDMLRDLHEREPPPPEAGEAETKLEDTLERLAVLEPAPQWATRDTPEDRFARARIYGLIQRQIQANWRRPRALQEIDDTAVILEFQLQPDGTIHGLKISEAELARVDRNMLLRPLLDSAQAAILRTGKITGLPPEDYELWRRVRLNFRPPR